MFAQLLKDFTLAITAVRQSFDSTLQRQFDLFLEPVVTENGPRFRGAAYRLEFRDIDVDVAHGPVRGTPSHGVSAQARIEWMRRQ